MIPCSPAAASFWYTKSHTRNFSPPSGRWGYAVAKDEGAFSHAKTRPFLPERRNFIHRETRWQSSNVILACFWKKATAQDKTGKAEGVQHMSTHAHSPKHSWLGLFLDPIWQGPFKFRWLLSVCITERTLFKQNTLFLARESQDPLSSLFMQTTERPLFFSALDYCKKTLNHQVRGLASKICKLGVSYQIAS